MSAQEQDPVVPIGPDFAVGGVEGVSTLYLYDTSAAIAEAATPAEADAVIGDIQASVTRIYGTTQADEINGVWRGIQAAIDDGDLLPKDIPGFFSYLRYNLGIPSLTAAAVAAAGIAGLILKYKLSQGYNLQPTPLPGTTAATTAPVQPTVTLPLAPTPTPVPNPPAPVPVTGPPVPAPSPPPVVSPPVVTPPSPVTGSPQPSAPVAVGTPATTGQSVVVTAAQGIVNQSVTAPGLTPAEAQAISTALGISVADVYGVVARVVDLMLPLMAPGQVPAALTDLFNAVAVLESQLSPIISGIRDNGGMATGDQLAAAQGALQALMAQVGTVEAQLGDQAPSELQTEITALQGQVGANTSAISTLVATVPTLATVAALSDTQVQVTTAVEQLGATAPSVLGENLASTTAIAQDALRIAEDAEACCSAQTENLSSDENALGGKSNLPNLGKIAGWLFGLTFVAGILDAVVAVFDLPAAFAATAGDAAAISKFADAVAVEVLANPSWQPALVAA